MITVQTQFYHLPQAQLPSEPASWKMVFLKPGLEVDHERLQSAHGHTLDDYPQQILLPLLSSHVLRTSGISVLFLKGALLPFPTPITAHGISWKDGMVLFLYYKRYEDYQTWGRIQCHLHILAVWQWISDFISEPFSSSTLWVFLPFLLTQSLNIKKSLYCLPCSEKYYTSI